MTGERMIKADIRFIAKAIMLFALIFTVQLSNVRMSNAMTSTNYEISTNVVGSSGGGKSSSGYRMSDTVGQPTAIGKSASTGFLGELGFIFTSMFDNRPPLVTVEAPNGGESVNGGTFYNVAWRASDNVGLKALPVTIKLSIDGGASWPYVWSSLPNTSPYSIKLPNITSSQCLISVEAVDIVGNTGRDVSNAMFTISTILDNAPPDQVILAGPDHNEHLICPSVYAIKWEAHDYMAAGDQLRANLYYTTDEVTWKAIAANVPMVNGGIGGIGEYPWSVPVESSNTCRVRVEVFDPSGNAAFDESKQFKIGKMTGSRIYVMIKNEYGDVNYVAVPFNMTGIDSTSDLARSIGDQWPSKTDFNYITFSLFNNLSKSPVDDTWFYMGGDWVYGTDAAVNVGDAVGVTLGTDVPVAFDWTISGDIPDVGQIIYGLYKNSNGDVNRIMWTGETTDTFSIARSIGDHWLTKVDYNYIRISIFRNDAKASIDDTWFYVGGEWLFGDNITVEEGDIIDITIGTEAPSATISGWQ